MNLLQKLFGIRTKAEPPPPASSPPPVAPPTVATPPARQPDSDAREVHTALSRFLGATDKATQLEQLTLMQRMGSKSLPPLLHEAFEEQGDPARQPIDMYRIRLAVWCGCALHPGEFDFYYRTTYRSGRSPTLDEMRAINMKDGLNRSTPVQRLLDRQSPESRPAAAEAGPPGPHEAPAAEHQLALGMKAYLGQEAPQDYAQARQHFEAAAAAGSAAAQVMLGILFDNGFGVPKDYAAARRWFQRAAEQGEPGAEFCLGVMHRDGRGVPQDFSEAAKWIRSAADKGYAEAQFNLGVMFLYGHGVSQDIQQAARWWRRSAERGNANAQKNLELLRSKGYCE